MPKETSKILETISSTLSNPGTPTDYGCDPGLIEKYKSLSKSIYPEAPVCVVSHWTLWDLDIPEDLRQHPSVGLGFLIKSDHIIEDEKGRFSTGDWVRTSLVQSIEHNCIFKTGNTAYILVGSGGRLTVDPKIVNSLF